MSRVLRNVVVLDDAALERPRSRPRRLTELVGDTFSEAYERGKRDGLSEGRHTSDEATAGLGVSIEAALRGALAELRSLVNQRISFVVTEAMAVAEFVIGHEISAAADSLVSRIEAALAALDDEPLTIHVAPGDFEAVAGALASNSTVSVAEDPDLGTGEAKVTGPWASADLTIRAAIEVAEEVLR